MTRPSVEGLRALVVNCTLTPSPGRSHTAGARFDHPNPEYR